MSIYSPNIWVGTDQVVVDTDHQEEGTVLVDIDLGAVDTDLVVLDIVAAFQEGDTWVADQDTELAGNPCSAGEDTLVAVHMDDFEADTGPVDTGLGEGTAQDTEFDLDKLPLQQD